MSRSLSIRNRQRTAPVNARYLRRLASGLLVDVLAQKEYDLGLGVVGTVEMTRLNETFLRHKGSTDVITFDYSEPETQNPKPETILHGEIFLCIDEAVAQARRFRTSWESELVRYLVHGVLHLLGHDDSKSAARRKMKREENRLLKEIARRFPLSKLARNPRLAA